MTKDLTLAPATGPDGALALFVDMYHPGTDPGGMATARKRLVGMMDAGWRLTELRDGAAVVGFALWVDLAEYVFLRSFAVDRAARSHGLGRVFFQRLLDEVLPPHPQIRIEVDADGPHGFWEKQGFQARTTGMWLDRRETA